MGRSKVMHGARAVLWLGTSAIGVFNNVSYQVNYDVSPAFILGRFSAAELVYTGAEVINISASGFRVLKHGPFSVVDAGTGSRLFPRLQDLLTYEDITVSLHDRSEADPEKSLIMCVTNVKPASMSSSVAARGLQEQSFNMMGLHYSDEDGESVEGAGATELPDSE